ncbi:hypothetical protein NNC19_07655 [Clostridium sp. SHJSY1]|uniref:hypothetical protein n=1 Tax=Clostridium sp. SHJSY1 TaxID=2942483 RepID=UPI0028762C38|nr:hypothetical protein [Clostridium sp. SHJSY1]MDS0525548.1 hypothetical protein [Clostridium sp. SHJSY1]
MNKKDLIDIDENKLPNISLSEEQINRIKKSLYKNIKRFTENNYELKTDISLENIKRIEANLGDRKDDIIHGVKHARVLKELALQATRKDCTIKDKKIICDKFFQIGAGMENKDATLSIFYSVFYCQIYISKDYFISYSFDNFYRLQHRRIIPMKYIKAAGISRMDKDRLKLSSDNLIIDIDYRSNENLSTYYLVGKMDDMVEVKDLLITLGAKPFNHKRFSIGRISGIIYYSIFALAIVYFFINLILHKFL